MPRGGQRWTLAQVQRLNEQGATRNRRKPSVRPVLRLPPVTQEGDTIRLIYQGWLPAANQLTGQYAWLNKRRLKQLGRQTFGVLPQRTTSFARVRVTRVLGKRQRPMDRDNVGLLTKVLVDSAVLGGYLVDDKEKWADITYHQDATKRSEGPYIHIEITYLLRKDA